MRNNLRQCRKHKKQTHESMAALLGIGVKQYSRLEAGTSYGSVKVWLELSAYFNKSINFLLEQEPTPTE